MPARSVRVARSAASGRRRLRLDGVSVHHVHRLHAGELALAHRLGLGLHAVEVELRRLRVEVGAVVELHALAQLEDDGLGDRAAATTRRGRAGGRACCRARPAARRCCGRPAGRPCCRTDAGPWSPPRRRSPLAACRPSSGRAPPDPRLGALPATSAARSPPAASALSRRKARRDTARGLIRGRFDGMACPPLRVSSGGSESERRDAGGRWSAPRTASLRVPRSWAEITRSEYGSGRGVSSRRERTSHGRHQPVLAHQDAAGGEAAPSGWRTAGTKTWAPGASSA